MKRRIGFLPENPYFYDNLTAEELLGYFAGLFGYQGADRTERVARLLDDVGVGAERRLQLRKFSKGMIQRVGLAQAIINDPEVVFLDEPMSGLDPLGRREVRQLILRLRDEGRTVFFSSHILADAEALCSRDRDRREGPADGRPARSPNLVRAQLKGWEIVVDGLAAAAGRRAPGCAQGDADRRGALRRRSRCPPRIRLRDAREVLGRGGRLISVNPIRETLEDLFVRQVDEAAGTRLGSAPAPMTRRRGRRREDAASPARPSSASRSTSSRSRSATRCSTGSSLFAVLLIAASLLLGQLTAGQEVKIIKDLGLAAISIFGLFIAIFIGIGLVSKEVERRSIYALLVKPMSRPQFVLGKFLGLVLTLAVNVAVMTVALSSSSASTMDAAAGSQCRRWKRPALDPRCSSRRS